MNTRRDSLKTSGSLLGSHHHAREYEVIEGKIMMDYFVEVKRYNF